MKLPKTVIYLHPHFTLPGGAGKVVLETGKRLAEDGWQVIVICIRAETKIVKPYSRRIQFIKIGGPLSSSLLFWLTFPRSVFKVTKILNQYQDFILFPQIFPANWWGFWYKKTHPQIKTVWMCQEPSAFIHSAKWRATINSPLKRWLAQILQPTLSLIDVTLAQHINLVLANSKFSKQYIRKIYRYPENKIKIIPLGADNNIVFPNKPRKNQIVTVGRLTKFKNIDLLIKAFALVIKMEKFRHYKLIIIGDGEERQNLKKLSSTLGIDQQIIFAGNIPDHKKQLILDQSRVFVLASENEPFGLVVIEALRSGLIVVAHNSGGPAEILTNEFLFKTLSPTVLAQKLADILTKYARHQLKSPRTKRVLNYYTWENSVKNLKKFFNYVN